MRNSFTRISLALALAIASAATSFGQASPTSVPNLFTRHYREGEALVYHMTATNKDHSHTASYQAQATGIVNKDSAGHFYEEYEWSDLILNGRPLPIPAAKASFREILSLDPAFHAQFPDMRAAFCGLVGPILDWLTFYADLGLAIRHPGLNRPGDHIYVKYGKPAAWGAAQGLILGESSIDFDLTLQSIDRRAGTAVLLVRHVPPAQSQIHLPAAWMRVPVVDTPNNWVQIAKNASGKFVAAVGKEIFNDRITVSLKDGRILFATMRNPVQVLQRECADAALTVCSPPIRYQILRKISVR